ncbi:uncharacterized protein HD556DRAFT_1445977 [Suillus plorans]|uniref:DUF6533 domain-containing protein n=1 Tax=Suillus plorans TaxID=116603 RepID=A0A9P7AL46_9AGAM|nr:uncharacterized protein HD556DRAFT_1445977 [Suillus plorans]KAG1790695.1 hypothetical protein HD556DRAFT_1445977 [Suillus plorans]
MATLPEEIMLIWCRPKATSAVLFLINRYLAVLGGVVVLISNFLPVSPKQIFICLTLSLRTYALYGRSRRLLKWMGIIGLVLIAGALAVTFGDDSDAGVDAGDCHEIYTTATTVHHGMAWMAMFIYELLIFVLTVFRAWKTRGLRFSLLSRRDILDVIFQDGIFRRTGIVNTEPTERRCDVLRRNDISQFTQHSDAPLWFSEHTRMFHQVDYFLTICKENIRGSLSVFTTCMSVTLISRLMLNLHGCVDTGIFSTPAETSPDVLTTRIDVEFAVSSDHW